MQNIKENDLTEHEVYNNLVINTKKAIQTIKKNNQTIIYTMDTRQLRQQYKIAVDVWKTDKTEENLTSLMKTKKVLNKAIKKEKRKIQSLKLNELKDAKTKNDNKKFWQLMNNKKMKNRKRNNTHLSIAAFKNELLNRDKKLTDLNKKIVNYINVDNFLNSNIVPNDDTLNIRISVNEITDALKNMANSKSSGPDHVVYEILKMNMDNTLQLIDILFNNILNNENIPWKISWITPIYKKGDRNDVSSYRFINLSSCLEKLLTKIFNNRLNQWIEKYELLHQSQIGFRKDNSTIDCIWILKEIIRISKNNKTALYLCFIDLSKAFDSIPKDGLLYKLSHVIPRGRFLSLLQNILMNKNYQILFNDEESNTFKLNNGIPQGDSLSPTLFCLYMNDLLIELEKNLDAIDPISIMHTKLASLIYADDILLMSNSKKGLMKQIQIVQNYCIENCLSINFDKTKIMIYNDLKNYSHVEIRTSESTTTIEVVNEYKYLGVFFSKDDRKQINELAKQGKISACITGKTIKDFGYVDGDILMNAFEMLTISKMKYGSEFYFDRNIQDLNKIQTQFFKKQYHLKRTTPNYCIFGEFGVKPIEFHFYKAALNYWSKLNHLNENLLTKKIFKIINQNIEERAFHNTWVFRINRLIRNLALDDIHQTISLNSIAQTKKIINKRLTEYFRQQWIDMAKHSNKGLNYLELCRFECNTKRYLNITNNSKVVSTVLKMRTGNHNLITEIGRYNDRKTYDECICKNCNNNEIEDLFHYFCSCSKYDSIRNSIAPFLQTNSKSEFHQIMDTLNHRELKLLAKYIDEANLIRTT